MKRAARPRKETTRLKALATGLRLTTTAAPKTSMSSAKIQKSQAGLMEFRISNCKTRTEKAGPLPDWTIPNLESAICNGSFLFVPFQDDAVHNAADLEQLLLVMHHVFAGEAG